MSEPERRRVVRVPRPVVSAMPERSRPVPAHERACRTRPLHLPLVPAHEPPSLEARLARRTRVAAPELTELLDTGHIRCRACAHRCVIDEGRAGSCGVRFVREGALRVPHGYVARRYVRAVETNTMFHVRPGARSLTMGMYGCDLRCPYCHNWRVSQALREEMNDEHPEDITAEALVAHALEHNCEVLCAAFNEPMIAAEWAHEVFSRAKSHGLVTGLVSDGNTTREALAHMRPVTDVYRVDLKGTDDEQYRRLGGRFAPVFDAIEEARAQGYWVEVVTLVVPGFNDDGGALRALGARLARIDPNIPWHLNAMVPRYKLAERAPTPGMMLASVAGSAYAQGLRYVYVSNIPDDVSELSHTRCPRCLHTLVERDDYETRAVRLTDEGTCPACHEVIAGLWGPRARTRATMESAGDELETEMP